jgi:hypothetical protein
LLDDGDAVGMQTTSGTVERTLLLGITSLLPVQLASSAETFSSPRLLAWLHTHAQMVVRGQRLRLLCWCCDDGYCARPGSSPCHARSLAALILWLAYHLNEGTSFESRAATLNVATLAIDHQVHTRCLTPRCRLSPQPWHAGLLCCGVATSDQTSSQEGCPSPQRPVTRSGRLVSNANHDVTAHCAHMHLYFWWAQRHTHMAVHAACAASAHAHFLPLPHLLRSIHACSA